MIETSGCDTMLYIAYSNPATNDAAMEFDDDSGPGLGSRIEWPCTSSCLAAIAVTHAFKERTGSYSISVVESPASGTGNLAVDSGGGWKEPGPRFCVSVRGKAPGQKTDSYRVPGSIPYPPRANVHTLHETQDLSRSLSRVLSRSYARPCPGTLCDWITAHEASRSRSLARSLS